MASKTIPLHGMHIGTGMHPTLDGLLAAAGLRYLGGYPGLYQACAVACLLGAGLALTVRSSR
ncbi:hypothetical protein [Corynebacterium sp. Marseille-P4321]|uniref:hypothetical protein n=1 Tax=Corynebacterium sp. Marseille-P4321 TaxID=2736603 RepID=UPI00158A8244|nr:hypothetical protein [Corynebacterium sp. Marseille-P4321]